MTTANPYAVIKHPLVTEKSMRLGQDNQYVFDVNPDANKVQIAKAVEAIFNVKVEKVRTLNVKPEQRPFGSRARKKKARKKAIVTLIKGNKIDLEI